MHSFGLRSISAGLCIWLLAAAPSSVDARFLQTALADSRGEIAEAVEQTHSPDSNVRFYAATIALDHRTIDTRLQNIAVKLGVAVPRATPRARAALRPPAAYLKEQITLHQQQIALYQVEVQAGTDPRLRALAKEIMPILQSNLSLARKLLIERMKSALASVHELRDAAVT